MMNKDVIANLNFLCRTYDGINKLLVSTKNRLQALNPEMDMETNAEIKALESMKGSVSRKITKECKLWPIYTEWLEAVPGAGPYVSGNLILMYYYKFTPVCECGGEYEKKDNGYWCLVCGQKAKGEGCLKHRIDERDFANVSKWWAYLGRHIEEGKMPKRAKGKQANWSTKGRVVTYMLGDQFNRQKAGTPYKDFFLAEKREYEKRNEQWLAEGKTKKELWTKGHIHNAAANNTIKLFLSHFWHVARTLDGKSTDGPYSQVILGHTGIIAPYYWNEHKEEAA